VAVKRMVRARAAKTGESCTSALRHFRKQAIPSVRLAVAQTLVREDPRDVDALRESGREVRALMREASTQGARMLWTVIAVDGVRFGCRLGMEIHYPEVFAAARTCEGQTAFDRLTGVFDEQMPAALLLR
jgi:hypothetical protein